MKRTLAVSLVLLLAASVMASGQQRRRTRARVAPSGPASQCDRLAAHLNDPQARARGVGDEALDASAVIDACEAEAAAEPDEPRLSFQLARGYLKAGRVEDAIEQLVAAGKGGHGGALAYLGDLYLDGAAGLEPDPALAHTLYQRAAEAGFAPAKTMLAQFEDFTERAAAADEAEAGDEKEAALAAAPAPKNVNAKYINPAIVDNILKGDLDAVPYGELYTKAYLVNMADNIAGVCEGAGHFTRREVDSLKQEAALKSIDMTPEAGLSILMGTLMGFAQMKENPGAFLGQQMQAANDQEHLPEEAMKDAFTLIDRHTCGTRELSQFSRNLVAYVRNEGAPRMSTNELYGVCNREARPTGRYDARNFCMCFVSAMSQTGVARADRKGLSSDFWPSAQRIMAKQPDHYAMCNR
ncbi:MAG TPA: tetratricopeptide repeat protein [Pyrinomonadaceae bacterium]